MADCNNNQVIAHYNIESIFAEKYTESRYYTLTEKISTYFFVNELNNTVYVKLHLKCEHPN